MLTLSNKSSDIRGDMILIIIVSRHLHIAFQVVFESSGNSVIFGVMSDLISLQKFGEIVKLKDW